MRPSVSPRPQAARKVVHASIVVALSIAFFSHVFRLSSGTFLTTGLGDWVDPYFINFLLEHWHHSFWTLSDPTSPAMYFPARGTLGYSHGLILYAPFYIAVRTFLNPFPAHTVALLLVLETGALCLYLLFRHFARLGFIESLLLCALFFSSANVVNSTIGVWSQRASVFLIPPILLMGLWGRTLRSRHRLGLGWLSGLLAGLLFIQDFYTAALTILASALLLTGALSVAPVSIERGDPRQGSPPPSWWWLVITFAALSLAVAFELRLIVRTPFGRLRFSTTHPTWALSIAILAGGYFVARKSNLTGRIVSWWKEDKQYMSALALGGFMGCLMFLWIYVGAYRAHPSFPGDQLMNAFTAIDVSQLDWKRLVAYETFRPFALVFAVAMLAWVPWFNVEKTTRLWSLGIFFASLIVLVIPLRLDGFSVWKVFFAPLPGLSAIRDPKRMIEGYELAVALLAALFLTRLPSKSPLRVFIAALVLFVVVSTWNRQTLEFDRPTDVYARWVEAPIDVDASCKSFFIKGASGQYMSRSFHMWGLYGIDSMFISLSHSIPTLNGYSAWWPDDWALSNPQETGYTELVSQWIERNHLADVCELDIEARTMRPYAPIVHR